MGILDKLIELINSEEGENEEKKEITSQEDKLIKNEDSQIKISEVTNFIRELESYYTADIFKERSNFINANLSEEEIIFQKKKIAEDEEALEDISAIKEEVIKQERSCSDIWGKSSYSFYDELETRKLEEIFKKTFEIVKKLVEANTKEELDETILKRIEKYYKSWKIGGEFITPINTRVRIKDRKSNKETYQFGAFQKIILAEDEKNIIKEQLDSIKKMNIQIKKLPSTKVWIRCVTITRSQLNFIKKTLVFQNDWEVGEKDKLTYDIVYTNEIEYYIRGILQLILQRKEYVLISILVPSRELMQQLSQMISIDDEERKVTILDKPKYILMERNGAYKDNLIFKLLSRKDSLKQVSFICYESFVKNFLNK